MDVFEKVIFDDSTGKFKKRRKYIRIYIERRIERAGRACISAMSLRLAALLLRSRDSPYKGMGNEVKRGEKASVPNRFDNQHEWQRDKSEESSARPLMENVIPLSLSPFFPSTSSLHYLSLHLVSILPLDPPFYRACHATEKKRCVQIYRRWNHPVKKDDPESRTNRIESNRASLAANWQTSFKKRLSKIYRIHPYIQGGICKAAPWKKKFEQRRNERMIKKLLIGVSRGDANAREFSLKDGGWVSRYFSAQGEYY